MAKSKLITFGKHLSNSLRELGKSHVSFRQKTSSPKPRQNSAFVAMAKTPEGGIPARSVLEFGEADCTFAYLNSDNELADFTSLATEAVFNPYFFPIPGGIYIDVNREVFSGRLLVFLKGGFIGYLGYGQTITARSGDTLGVGTDIALWHQGVEDPDQLVDLETVADVYNTTTCTPSTSEIYIQLKISYQGYLLWDVDDCCAAV